MEANAPSNVGEYPYPLKMCYQALQNLTNSFGASRTWPLVFTLVAVFTLVERPGIHEIWTFKLNLTKKINTIQPTKQ